MDVRTWIEDKGIEEVECLVPDLTGIARGKIIPSRKFLYVVETGSLRLPEAVFSQTVTGDFVEKSEFISESNRDVTVIPDLETIRVIPWCAYPAAQVICDISAANDGALLDLAPRTVLKRVLRAYEQRGWRPVVAPELEFYFVKRNLDPDYPLAPPVGASGRRESGRQAYGVDAANEFDPVVEDIYDFCEKARIGIDTMIHEVGAGQMEFNLNHGAALDLADQVFLFKRVVRQAALKHGIYATFMAKPHENEPGSAMHIHQSVVEIESGRNIFATPTGRPSRRLMAYIAGLQRYAGAAMSFFAPNVNSYRRIAPYSDAPINTHWGSDNRTVGLRIPKSLPQDLRVENRLPGADVNPYLAIAATLACGLLGIRERRKASRPVEGDAYRLAFTLPRHQSDAFAKLNHCRPLRALLGERFVRNLMEVKTFEYELYRRVISSWERENLLLNV